SQTSRAGTPASSACCAVRKPVRESTRSRRSVAPYCWPNSSRTARWNSLSRIRHLILRADAQSKRSRLANGEVGIELMDELVGNRVGYDRLETLKYRDPIAHLAHDDRDRRIERLGHRGEDL